jgi:phage shock protein C
MDEQRSTEHRHRQKLYKLKSDRMIDGVCAGIADYLNVDPSVVRLTLVAFTILSFWVAIIFYIAAMVVMPVKPLSPSEPIGVMQETSRRKHSGGGMVAGVVILIVGIILLFHHYNISLPWFGLFDLHLIGRLALPIIIILIGCVLLMGREKESMEHVETEEPPQSGEPLSRQAGSGERQRLFRSIHDVKVAGVCGGFAEYLNIDSTLIRLVVVLLSLASFGMALILYFVCALVIPKEKT